jgi:nidogen-like/PEP-CTERM motif-containing protein
LPEREPKKDKKQGGTLPMSLGNHLGVQMRPKLLIPLLATAGLISSVQAAVIVIPQSVLIPSTTLYTQDLGISIGSTLVMTGGGNAPNIGGADGRNDDGFSGPINFGFNFSLFGTTYTSFFANNNGNITFESGLEEFTPTGLQGATQPVVSPFFADVDTRNPASGVMSLQTHTSAAGNEVILTWPNVGFFDSRGDPLNTFQMVIRQNGYAIPAGEGQVGFFWTTMGWEVGEASGGGSNGLCEPGSTVGINQDCTPAAVGFGNGNDTGIVLQGSTENGIADVLENHRLWFGLVGGTPGVVVDGSVPEPSTILLLALGGLAMAANRRRRAIS